ncbi:MAG: TAT-variant-translocated molybdopterin oxidoreductase [Alphaproteobacteria bacterium]
MPVIANSSARKSCSFDTLRRRLGQRQEPWRGLDELADSDAFREYLASEFPAAAASMDGISDRRTVLKLLGASLALAGLSGCDEAESIVPYVNQPENVIPGKPRYYATTLASGGYGIGALIETHEGRPTKVEGNPDHPASRGATDAVMQAAVLAAFDPDRSQWPTRDGRPISFQALQRALAGLSYEIAETRGRGFAILLEPTTSPTLKRQLQALRLRLPEARVFLHDPLGGVSTDTATRHVFGRDLAPIYRFDRADVVLSLDADFLNETPGRLAYARDFAARRRVRHPADDMSRVYVIESTPTITGATADHRIAVKPSAVDSMAAYLEARGRDPVADTEPPGDPAWFAALASDLEEAGRNALVVPGANATTATCEAAMRMNVRLGSVGHTVAFIDPPHRLAADGDLADFCSGIRAGRIDAALVLQSNPVHTAPAELDVAGALDRVPRLFHLGLYQDETALHAKWHIPATHEIESWGDLRAFDGTASIIQPLIRPLYNGIGVHEVIAAISGEASPDVRTIVRESWAERMDETAWRKSLKRGVVADSAFPAIDMPPPRRRDEPVQQTRQTGLELRFVPDPFLWDGRHANSAMLQELPRPITKLVWGNAALLSPATAEELGVGNEQVVRISHAGRTLEAPVWIVPGHPDETVTLSLGHGRQQAGTVAAMASGYDAFLLKPLNASSIVAGATVEPTGGRIRVLTTQHHQAMEGRHIVRHTSLEKFRANPGFVNDGVPPAPTRSLYPRWRYPGESWGMSIDQSTCIGCMSCVAACQTENNIATVGPDECARGHELHWLRVDRYYHGSLDTPDTFFQPVPCMHCEKAPCETVCPVNATVHTHDGLNAQVYNRCIGTRYCSQNCPYKVRRFNFLQYVDFDKETAGPQQAARNPDVSIRSRGVMEKCTYCVQRISKARIDAQLEDRAIDDGAVITACQQACPTEAIVFGNINDADSRVVEEKGAAHSYALLAELNTRPRTTYLGRIGNPNPELARQRKAAKGDSNG